MQLARALEARPTPCLKAVDPAAPQPAVCFIKKFTLCAALAAL